MARLYYGHVTARGLRINYYRTGGEKPAVVLIHGLGEYGMGWGRFPVFIEPSYDVVMMDLRGHGMSDKPESGYGIDVMAQDLFWLIKTLNLSKPVVLGHSLGANVAAEFALQNPGLLSGLILEDPPWRLEPAGSHDQELAAERYLKELEEQKKMPLQALIERCRSKNPTWTESEHLQWAKGRQLVSLHTVERFRLPSYAWQDLISELKAPGLLMTADVNLGGILSTEAAEQAAKLWRKSELVHFPGAGHFIHREQYYAFRDVTKKFLRKML
jgi:pimeloyl-ACP methyl ester carboxylesterase